MLTLNDSRLNAMHSRQMIDAVHYLTGDIYDLAVSKFIGSCAALIPAEKFGPLVDSILKDAQVQENMRDRKAQLDADATRFEARGPATA